MNRVRILLAKGRRAAAIFVLALSFLVVLPALSGCSRRPSPAGPKEQPSGSQPTAPVSEGYPVTIEDDLGNTITLEKKPLRIVSMAPSNTEILFALGAGDRVVGVDDYSNFPPEANKVEKIGGFSTPSIEKIVSLRPDLVLGTDAHEKFLPQLARVGLPALLLSPRTVDGVLKSVRKVGRAIGAAEQAEQLADDMSRRLEGVEARYSSSGGGALPKVYYEVYSDPMMSVGPKTLIHQVIVAAGGRNIFDDADKDYPIVSSEAVLDRNPDVIVFPKFHGTGCLTVEELRARPGWTKVAAVRDGRVYPIDADLISRPGPRIVEAVETLAGLLWKGR